MAWCGLVVMGIPSSGWRHSNQGNGSYITPFYKFSPISDLHRYISSTSSSRLSFCLVHSFHPHSFLNFPPDMTRLVSLFSVALVLFALPSGLAGPACTKKHWQAKDCVQRCKSRWGWTGSMMGTDPWGSVMQKTDGTAATWEAALNKACGTEA